MSKAGSGRDISGQRSVEVEGMRGALPLRFEVRAEVRAMDDRSVKARSL
jgi:hypothetical protein